MTDGRTDGLADRITTPKTALSIARAVKIGSFIEDAINSVRDTFLACVFDAVNPLLRRYSTAADNENERHTQIRQWI